VSNEQASGQGGNFTQRILRFSSQLGNLTTKRKGAMMHSIYGIALIAIAIGMVWVGRPPKGEAFAPFLRVWIVAQIYILTVMISAVVGITFLIVGWSA
jgi:hypothetical protein